jgi:membrane-bound lytic murein transglycosylase D
MKKTILLSLSILIVLFGFKLLTSSIEAKSDFQLFKEYFEDKYSIFAIPKPNEEIFFAGEKIPLENPDVWERYDKEIHKNTYWQSNTLLLMKRAHKYFPIIEPILKKHNIPNDFKYLALIESGLENVTSPAKAKGIWQIMKGTATEFKLEVNNEVDERYNLEKSTDLACEFLLSAKEKFGTWTLAAASYNMGRTGLQKQINRQDQYNYFDLLLNRETAQYVFRMAAMKQIMEYPKKYGFHLQEEDFYTSVPCYTVEVDSAVRDWAVFAENYDINYKILKIHNPWLRENYLTNKSRKKYFIQIPEKGNYKTTTQNLKDSTIINE